MAATKITALTELASAYATGDLLCLVDVSDTTMDAAGTNKKTTLANLLGNLPGTPIGLAAQTYLNSDGANILALRNSTNAQAFRVYNTYTDGSNNEYGSLWWASNTLKIGTVANGSGTARSISFQYNGTDRMTIASTAITLASSIHFYLNSGILFGGSASSAFYGFKQKLENQSATGNVNAGRSMGIYTNSSASGGITLTMPTMVEGYDYKFVDNNATHRLTVVPNTGDQIVWTDGTVVSAATGSVVSTAQYNSFWGVALDATTFKVLAATGTWTVTP